MKFLLGKMGERLNARNSGSGLKRPERKMGYPFRESVTQLILNTG